MLCEVCKKKIRTQLNIFNIFQTEKHHICERCFQKYPLLPGYQTIPIDQGMIDHYYLISKNRDVSPISYMSFLKVYYVHYLKHHKQQMILYFDVLSDQLYEILDSLKLGDIYLVTLYDNIKKKEKNYEIRSVR